MSTAIEGQTEEALALEFKKLELDELVILACSFKNCVTVEQMEANIGRMVGYGADGASPYYKNMARSVFQLITSQHLAYYDGGPNESGIKWYILTEKGRERKTAILDNFVDSMPEPMRDALFKRGAQ